MTFRIGQGFDVHRLAEGERLWLGGVLILHHKGTVAHSDGDVLIHAICDALLGAVKLGDIGTNFPNTSPEYKDIDSKILLEKTCRLVQSAGYEIVNVDSTISAQKPLLKPYINSMVCTLSGVMGVSHNRVSIKATTTEGLGFEGSEDGISAHAVVLVKKVNE